MKYDLKKLIKENNYIRINEAIAHDGDAVIKNVLPFKKYTFEDFKKSDMIYFFMRDNEIYVISNMYYNNKNFFVLFELSYEKEVYYFNLITQLEFSGLERRFYNKLNDFYKIEDVFVTESIITNENYRNKKCATVLLEFLIIKLGYMFISDTDQYSAMRKIWFNLSKSSNIKVDIVDLTQPKSSNIIHKNIQLKSISDNLIWVSKNDFDNSYNSLIKGNYDAFKKKELKKIINIGSNYKLVASKQNNHLTIDIEIFNDNETNELLEKIMNDKRIRRLDNYHLFKK